MTARLRLEDGTPYRCRLVATRFARSLVWDRLLWAFTDSCITYGLHRIVAVTDPATGVEIPIDDCYAAPAPANPWAHPFACPTRPVLDMTTDSPEESALHDPPDRPVYDFADPRFVPRCSRRAA